MRSEEGANAVEFAFVLPILILLLFGAITFGLAFNTKMQINHANREAVRYAATLPNAGTTEWFQDVLERAVLTSAGSIPVTDPTVNICMSVDTETGVVSRTASGHPDHSDSDDMLHTTPGDTHCHVTTLGGASAQVTVVRDARLNAVFFVRTVALSSDGVARYEGG